MNKKAYAIELDDGRVYIIDGFSRIDITHLITIDSMEKNYKRSNADMTVSFVAQMFERN